ncbi:ral guanine nucleotide dissociation stimulator like 3, partial [Chelydra serpentina]
GGRRGHLQRRPASGEGRACSQRGTLPAGCETPGAGPLVLGGEGGPEGCGEPPDLLSFSAEEVAEQLTLMDIELFVQVQPFHCLGCVWSQRDRRAGEGAAPSVRATVAQFNAVTGCVVASVLGDVQLRALQRARLLEKWVTIAQHCYFLRNFSSLRAVISALQSSPVHRLKRTWAAVGR